MTGSRPTGAMVLQATRMNLPLSLAGALNRVVDEGVLERGGQSFRALASRSAAA